MWKKRKVPFIAQTEVTECGLACIAMIAHYHGREESLSDLRRRFGMSLKGVTLRRLVDVADAIGMQSRPLQLDLDELRDLRTPCILHWNFNHFVVLKSANARRIAIHDPAVGVRNLALSTVSKHFTGVALELSPQANFQTLKGERGFSMFRALFQMPGIYSSLARIMGLALLLQIVNMAAPLFVQVVLDQVVATSDRELLSLAGAGFLALLLVQTCLTTARSWTVSLFSARLNVGWIAGVFSHLLKLPEEYFQRRGLSDIVSRVGAVSNIQRTLTSRFVEVALDGLTAVVALALMLAYSISLAAMTAGALVLYASVRLAWFKPLREANLATTLALVKSQGLLFESIRGARSIRLHNAIAAQTARHTNVTVAALKTGLGLQRLALQFSGLNFLIFGCQRIAVLWGGALLVIDGRLSVGMLIAFSVYSTQFVTCASGFVDYLFELRMLQVDAERLSDIVLSAPETHVVGHHGAPIAASPRIELRGIGYRYSDGDRWVLRGLNLVIESGESVALVGPSGCGKTTLAKIILGLLDPHEGVVLIDAVPIAQLGKERLRAISAAVLEEDALFSGSIAENIAFFDSGIDMQRVTQAACEAAIHDEISAMPMGYESLVGDIGASLSAGQLQRLLLARALYKKPQILVLDEATSRLDPANELKVTAAIRAKSITRICIAHRPDTIAAAGRCISLDGGGAVRVLL